MYGDYQCKFSQGFCLLKQASQLHKYGYHLNPALFHWVYTIHHYSKSIQHDSGTWLCIFDNMYLWYDTGIENGFLYVYRLYAMGRMQLIFCIRSGNIRFLEMGWRGKRDFTVLNNSVLRKHNGLIIR